MKIPLQEMTVEQLVAELPKRMLAMAVFLALVCVVISIIAAMALNHGLSWGYMLAFVACVLAAPFPVARVARWMVAPAHERRQRRRERMHRALAEFSFHGGDSRV
ncbi:MAG: hypothetical protein MUF01_01990 [Bryobacterales bacterium]|nr:hypothetical protein [Bryobacterales bacterium]